MKIVNIILCVLILLLAAVSAVFSYFLFEKRSQFVTGWAKMAETMNKTASALDRNSGTKIASKLTAQALAHENYSNIDSLLPELPKLGAQVITERDALASALSNISRSIQMAELVQPGKLQDLNTYSVQKDRVVKGVYTVIDNRDKTYRNLENAFRSQLNIRIDRQKLLAGNADAFSDFRKELGKRNARLNACESRLREIAGLLRASSPNMREGEYEASFRKMVAEIRAYRDKCNATAAELDREKAKNRSNLRTIASLENDKKKLNNTVTDKNLQINSFQRALGIPDAAGATKPWKAGSVEARERVAGKVTLINPAYGYLAMNLGKYSVVQQHIGNRTLEINPQMEPGLDMLITRRSGSKKQFIARVKISQVGETASIANIPPEAKDIRVGDEVTIAPAPETAAEATKAGAIKIAPRKK